MILLPQALFHRLTSFFAHTTKVDIANVFPGGERIGCSQGEYYSAWGRLL
jgi:transcriptional regulator of nitric oxide reductase